MRKYTIIDWDKVLLWLLPPILRKTTHISWLKTLLTPLSNLYEDTLYKMQHTGQVIYLEKVLNEIFNPSAVYNPNYTTEQKQFNNLIYIDETLQPKLNYVYKHEEYYLHNPDEHFTSVSNNNGEIILDVEGFLDPIEIFTHHELSCDPCYENSSYPIYHTYLANTSDYTDVAYANFRIMIPHSLKIDLTPADLNNDGAIDSVEVANALQKITNEIYYVPHSDIQKATAGAIEVRSPKFHQIVNFYKLAGKTYETYEYNNPNVVIPDIEDCDCNQNNFKISTLQQ